MERGESSEIWLAKVTKELKEVLAKEALPSGSDQAQMQMDSENSEKQQRVI